MTLPPTETPLMFGEQSPELDWLVGRAGTGAVLRGGTVRSEPEAGSETDVAEPA